MCIAVRPERLVEHFERLENRDREVRKQVVNAQQSTHPLHKHLTPTMLGPLSSYSAAEIHIEANVDNDAKIWAP